MQLSMLDLMRPGPILRPVERDGAVIQGMPDVTLRLPHPRMAWDLACIELHEHEDGLWMWSVQICGAGYKVGPKWGKFAQTQADATYFAASEMLRRTENMRPEGKGITAAQLTQIRDWARALT